MEYVRWQKRYRRGRSEIHYGKQGRATNNNTREQPLQLSPIPHVNMISYSTIIIFSAKEREEGRRMEDIRNSEGSIQPTTTSTTSTEITSKLPSDNKATNADTVTATSDGKAAVTRPLAKTVESLQLTVIEGFQVGRGVARIDPSDMAKLDCQPGDIVLVIGSRTTAAKVVPSAIIDRGQQTIQMDSQVRQNSASGLGERITVRKAKVRNAEKVTLLPLSGGAPIQESDLQYITRYLVGLPVTIGDLLRVGTPGAAPRDFLIISTTPTTPSYTVQRKRTGELPIEPSEETYGDVEAVLVQAGTVIRAQARGAANPGGPGR